MQTQCQTRGCGDDPDTGLPQGRRVLRGRETRSEPDGGQPVGHVGADKEQWPCLEMDGQGASWRSDILHEEPEKEAWWLEQEALGEVGEAEGAWQEAGAEASGSKRETECLATYKKKWPNS